LRKRDASSSRGEAREGNKLSKAAPQPREASRAIKISAEFHICELIYARGGTRAWMRGDYFVLKLAKWPAFASGIIVHLPGMHTVSRGAVTGGIPEQRLVE